MKKINIATALEMRIAAAIAATAGSNGSLHGVMNRVDSIHKTLKAKLAAGLLTDAEYEKEAGELLKIFSNFDGLIGEASPRA